jgi:hypothetical protein
MDVPQQHRLILALLEWIEKIELPTSSQKCQEISTGLQAIPGCSNSELDSDRSRPRLATVFGL